MRMLLRGMLALALGASLGAEPKAQYDQLCAGCHGPDLRGGKGPSLLGPLKHGDKPADLGRDLHDGFPALGMPAFAQLGDGDLRALVVFLQERRKNQIEPGPAQPLDPKLVRWSERYAYRIEPIVTEGLEIPWSLDWLPDGRMLVTERPGRLRIIEHGHLLPQPVEWIPAVAAQGEGGLMSVAVHPDYAHNGWIYLSFSDPGEGRKQGAGNTEQGAGSQTVGTAMTRIMRGHLRNNRLENRETIFMQPKEQYQEGYVMFGGRMAFDGPYLFFSVGERGVLGDAQNLAVPNGKIHRVFHDGTPPPDNPFIGRPGAWPSIWSYGHRNPQGLAIDPGTHEVWETEHGPRGGDELNRIIAGKNYGWPVVTFGINYDGTPVSDRTEAPGMEQPVRYWTPSIAVSQLMVYTGDRLRQWQGNLFVGSLAQQKFLRFEVKDGKVVHEEELFSNLGRVRDIKTGPDGLIYVALEQLHGASGWIVRLVPVIP